MAEYDADGLTIDIPSINEPWHRLDESTRLQSVVDYVVCDKKVSPEMALTTALGALSAASQAGYVVHVPGTRDVTHPVSLMLLIAANSGEGKTSVEKLMLHSVRKFQKSQEKANEKLLRKHEHQLDIWKNKRSALISLLKGAVKDGDEASTIEVEKKLDALEDIKPSPPTTINLVYEDTTPAALLQAMDVHLPVACIVSSEADNILNGFAMQQTAQINSLWSGSDITVSRKTSQSFTLSNARLTMVLMTQESSVEKYMKKRGQQARGSGLLARFLTVFPRPVVGNRDDIPTASQSTEVIESFHERITQLLNETIKRDKDSLEKPTELRFSLKAGQTWLKIRSIIEKNCQPGGFYENSGDHGTKIMENISRIAALIHLCERETNEAEIKEDVLIDAANIALHYSSHFLRHFSSASILEKNAEKIYNKMYSFYDKQKGNYHTSWISRYTHLTKEEILPALDLLNENGHVSKIDEHHYTFTPEKSANHNNPYGTSFKRRLTHYDEIKR